MRLLNVFLFCVLVIFISMVQSQSSLKLLKTLRQCKTKHRVQEDVLSCLRKMKLPNEWNSYCVIACVLKDIDTMDNENKFNASRLQELLGKLNLPYSSDQLKYLTKICTAEAEEKMAFKNDECKSVYFFMQCFDNIRHEPWQKI